MAGRVLYAVEANKAELVEALLRAGRLTEPQALDRAKVEAALASVVRDWAARWRKLCPSVPGGTAKPPDLL
jgi:hypothetical protein